MRAQDFDAQDYGVLDFTGKSLDHIMEEINYDLNLLYEIPCDSTKNIILNHLRDRMFMLESFLKVINQPISTQPQPLPLQPYPLPLQAQPTPTQPLPLQPQPIRFQPQPLPFQPQPIPTQPLPLQPQPLPFQPEFAPIEERLPTLLQPTTPGTQYTFTLQELSRFDGKNGNPAYVAVNGMVYDVTSNAAWGAATHFGLSAGKDLTNELVACHAGQPILSKLKLVGKLV